MNLLRFLPVVSLAAVALSSMADEALERRMLSHVEKIVVIDSINVPKNDFFRHYRIQPSAGAVLAGDEVAALLGSTKFPDDFRGSPITGFSNEFRDYLVWAQEDSTGYFRLAESVRLVGGDWETPRFTPTVLNFGAEVAPDSAVNANAVYPFMSDDGQSLYFAADNEFSLGGYDIFIASKDPSDGSFLIPGNMGMPFNSPYDDYMMVLDPQTGVGWWATDRNQLGDFLTIYVYALTDDRKNVDPDDENLLAFASLSGWQSLQDAEDAELRSKLLADIRSIVKKDSRTPEFTLPMPGGRTFFYFSDFKNSASSTMMRKYLAEMASLGEMEKNLSDLRRKFHDEGGKNLGAQIVKLEEQVRSKQSESQKLLSDIYKSEGMK